MIKIVSAASYVLVSLMIFTGSAFAANVNDCDKCSRYIELDKVKARCFQTRFEKQRLLENFSDETVQSIPVNFKCGLKSRDVVSTAQTTKNDPNSHYLTKSAIQCLYRLILDETNTFTPSRLISFEKHCVGG